LTKNKQGEPGTVGRVGATATTLAFSSNPIGPGSQDSEKTAGQCFVRTAKTIDDAVKTQKGKGDSV